MRDRKITPLPPPKVVEGHSPWKTSQHVETAHLAINIANVLLMITTTYDQH